MRVRKLNERTEEFGKKNEENRLKKLGATKNIGVGRDRKKGEKRKEKRKKERKKENKMRQNTLKTLKITPTCFDLVRSSSGNFVVPC